MISKMTRRQKADYCKAAVFTYLRFKKQCPYVATECGGFSSDLLALKDDRILEVEVKVDLSDFEADFEKPKHLRYQNGASDTYWAAHPNLFYFAIPEYLKEPCLKKIKAEFPAYGILIVKDPIKTGFGHWQFPVSNLKTAKDLRKGLIRDPKQFEHYREIISRRTGSQLGSLLEEAQASLCEALEKS